MSYNLDTNDTDESVDFTLNGHQYRLRLPTTDEALALGSLQQDGDSAKNITETMDAIYKFVTTVSEGAPPIKEVLGSASVKKLKAFMEMVKAEFSIGE